MPRINLLGGTYQARSVIADAQRCINLYPEINPGTDQDHPVTHYPTPGTYLLKKSPINNASRCNYRSSNGQLFRVIGPNVYYVDSSWNHNLLGSITNGTNICYMIDNGLVIVLVDGTNNGYAIDMVSHSFAQISSPNFVGATKVDYLDTFFLFNVVNTNQWYISLSEVNFKILTGTIGGLLTIDVAGGGTGYINGTYNNVPLTGGTGSGATANITVSGTLVTAATVNLPGQNYVIGDQLSASNANLGGAGSGLDINVDQITGGGFDPLDIATKDGYPDPIQTIYVVHTEIWLVGQLTTEVWYNSGASDFTFQRLPGTFIEHGCAAPYSIAKEDLNLFWLSQDLNGQAIVVMSQGYQLLRISTHAIENAIGNYSTISDATGYTYQKEGHIFYVLRFPTANACWVYDKIARLWHQRCWTDINGILNAHRANVCAFAYGQNVIGDYQNGNLLALDLNTYTDYVDAAGPNSDGSYPISRIRGFPHLVENANRISYRNFIADLETGNDSGTIDNSTSANPPKISLRYSDDRGRTYGNRVEQTMGAIGQFVTSVQFNRLGYARDRVFELSWSAPARTALQGAFINTNSEAT